LEARNAERSRLQIEEEKYLDHLYLISMYALNPLLIIVTQQELIRSARDEQTKDANGLDASSENQNDGTTTGRQTWPKRPRGEDASAGGNRKHKKLKKKNERDI
jgi:hypothetical protein